MEDTILRRQQLVGERISDRRDILHQRNRESEWTDSGAFYQKDEKSGQLAAPRGGTALRPALLCALRENLHNGSKKKYH